MPAKESTALFTPGEAAERVFKAGKKVNPLQERQQGAKPCGLEPPSCNSHDSLHWSPPLEGGKVISALWGCLGCVLGVAGGHRW